MGCNAAALIEVIVLSDGGSKGIIKGQNRT